MAALLSGCLQTIATGTVLRNGETGSSSSAQAGASSGTSAAMMAATGSGSGTGGSSTGGASETSGSGQGSSTGTGSSTGSPFADGGYVFCSLPDRSIWLCTPGTYLCDPADAGVCFQCLSDADCADEGRPTYDPKRPRCDLRSGIAGYQNFCQECLANADCANNPSGAFCDLSPTYPPAPISYSEYLYLTGSIEPSIVDLGFETCGPIQVDCRVDGGAICKNSFQKCDPDSGACETPSGA